MAFTLLLLPCPPSTLDSNQKVIEQIDQISGKQAPSPDTLVAALEKVYDYLDSTDGIRTRTWLSEQIEDEAVRNELKTWGDEVFITHPEFLDEAGIFVDDLKADFSGESEPDDLWARWEQGPHEMWLIWDALERFGWDVVGVQDDGDDARTVRESLRWLAKNDANGLVLRMWLDEHFHGLYEVCQSYDRQEAVDLLRSDYAGAQQRSR